MSGISVVFTLFKKKFMKKLIHEIQANILEKLLYSLWLTFTELQWENTLPTNQLAFHIKTLTEEWYIYKEGMKYFLTVSWKEYANAKDSHTDSNHKFQKVGTIIVCSRIWPVTWKKEYLFYTRKKHPFYGKQWFPTGKVRRWETPEMTASRELNEESWLQWDSKTVALFHILNQDQEQCIIEDKYLFLCSINNPGWVLCNSNEWEFYWLDKEMIAMKIQDPFESVQVINAMIALVENHQWDMFTFENRTIYPDWF